MKLVSKNFCDKNGGYFIFLEIDLIEMLKMTYHQKLQSSFDILKIKFRNNYIKPVTMLSHRHKRSSPTKQNISPQCHSPSPRKQANPIANFIRILEEHNIFIPAQVLQKTLHHQNKSLSSFKLKQVQCDNNTELKQLKVQLNDTKFELKKIEEDFAQFKVITRMEKQKTVKKYIGEIQTLKKKLEEDNKNWQKQYSFKCQEFARQKAQYQKNKQCQLQQKLTSYQNTIKSSYQHKVSTLQSKITSLTSQISQKQQLFDKQKKHLIEQLQQKSHKQILSLKTSTTQKQKQITKKLQYKIEVIELQRKIDCKKLQDQVSQLLKDVQNLNNQIYFLKKEKDQINADIKVKDRKIMHLQMAIRAKEQVYQQSLKEFEVQKNQIYKQHEVQIAKINEIHQQEVKQVHSKHLDQLDSYYQRINKLEEKRISLQEHYKEQMKILQQKFSSRISKSQDLQEIQRLNTLLILKDRQITRYQDDLRSSELARQNNQKNYTRIFSAHTSRRKSTNSHRDKEAFFKQSNTTDLKMILKICNKDF